MLGGKGGAKEGEDRGGGAGEVGQGLAVAPHLTVSVAALTKGEGGVGFECQDRLAHWEERGGGNACGDDRGDWE
ncbi:MAG TPA: hypothetical protein VER55_00110 [Ardenticatenaceae bacterium]|nr:hypothetical protein [Ardenticatenaceae bacterium]